MLALVTGCAGFIGSQLSLHLLESGFEIVGLDNLDPYYDVRIKEQNLIRLKEHSNFSFIKGDINESKDLEVAFSNTPDIVMHLAAKAGVLPSFKNPVDYARVNIDGTLNILEHSKDNDVSKLIFASSSSVYGDTSTVPYNEDEPNLRPISPYGLTKNHCEDYCRAYTKNYGIDINVLRFFTVYGPGQRPDMAITKFILFMLAGKGIDIYGDGNTYRDYTYISDIIDGISGAMNNFKGFNIYNLGRGEPITLHEMVSTISSQLEIKPTLNHKPIPTGDVVKTFADINKAKSQLGYEPKVDFRWGVEQEIQWVKELSSQGMF